MIKKALIIQALVSGAAIAAALAFSGTASADGSNISVCDKYGNDTCMYAVTLASGVAVTQSSEANSRNMTIDQAPGQTCTPKSGYDTCEAVYITFYNGDFVATTDNCDGTVIVKTGSAPTGNLWYREHINNTSQYYYLNPHCTTQTDQAWLYTDSTIGHAFLFDDGGGTGHYYAFDDS